jgi:hypothetical protein
VKKQNRALQRLVKPHGLIVRNAIGHGAMVVDATGRVVAKVHLETDYNVRCAVLLLRRRGAIPR